MTSIRYREDGLAETWRLLIDPASDGPSNMAIDEAILDLIGDGESPPTLRFYEWRSLWVSLGSGQSFTDLDPRALSDRGWQLVRRASGGTAVLHAGQVGYSLILPSTHPIWGGDLAASYERLAEPLRLALSRLGIDAEAAYPSRRSVATKTIPTLAERICFAGLGPHELTVKNRKIVGNSQIRRRLASTQHGVIQLAGGQAELADVLAGLDDDQKSIVVAYLRDRVGSIEDVVGRSVTSSDLRDAIVAGFDERLGIEFAPDRLSAEERALADTLRSEKYGHDGWTYRR
jgi:lipoate-protein ligase A